MTGTKYIVRVRMQTESGRDVSHTEEGENKVLAMINAICVMCQGTVTTGTKFEVLYTGVVE